MEGLEALDCIPSFDLIMGGGSLNVICQTNAHSINYCFVVY